VNAWSTIHRVRAPGTDPYRPPGDQLQRLRIVDHQLLVRHGQRQLQLNRPRRVVSDSTLGRYLDGTAVGPRQMASLAGWAVRHYRSGRTALWVGTLASLASGINTGGRCRSPG
jgi:hypothetical protein